jgi:NADH dehydrogenase
MTRIVILGGGFGGIRCALDLARRTGQTAEIIVVDRAAAHVFTPSLYEVASAYRESGNSALLKLRRSVSILYSEIFARTRIQHIQAEVVSADLNQKIIYLRDGQELAFDFCVLGVGSQATDYGIPGVVQNAYFFKTIDDALRLNIRLHELFRQYIAGPRDKPLQVLLVGAGFTGIELASELACCLRRLGRMHGIRKKFFSVMVFEAAPQMLPMLNVRERSALMKRLTEIGVATLDHSSIESVHSDHIKLVDGHIWRGDMIIWTAGIKPHPLLSQISGLPLTEHGKIHVDSHLRVQGSDSVFGVGDAIEFMDPRNHQPVPALTYTAMDQARLVARNITASIRERSLNDYHPKATSWIVPIGGKFVIAHLGGIITLTGVFGWLAKWFVDLRYFMSIMPAANAFRLLKKDFLLFSQNDQ